MGPSCPAELALVPVSLSESEGELLKFTLIALGGLVFVGLLVLLSIQLERLRSEGLQKIARRLDMRFTH